MLRRMRGDAAWDSVHPWFPGRFRDFGFERRSFRRRRPVAGGPIAQLFYRASLCEAGRCWAGLGDCFPTLGFRELKGGPPVLWLCRPFGTVRKLRMGQPRTPGVKGGPPSMPRSSPICAVPSGLEDVPSCSRHYRAGLWLCRPFGLFGSSGWGSLGYRELKGGPPVDAAFVPICAVPSGLEDCSILFPALPCRALVVSSLRDCLEAQDGAASDSGS